MDHNGNGAFVGVLKRRPLTRRCDSNGCALMRYRPHSQGSGHASGAGTLRQRAPGSEGKWQIAQRHTQLEGLPSGRKMLCSVPVLGSLKAPRTGKKDGKEGRDGCLLAECGDDEAL